MVGSAPGTDVIRIKNLHQMASFTDGAQWESPSAKVQPVNITLEIKHDITRTAETDDLTHSINYSSVSKTISTSCQVTDFDSLESLFDYARDRTFEEHDDVHHIHLEIQRPRGLLYPATTAIRAEARRSANTPSAEQLSISNLEIRTIIGINDCEREETQLVRFDLIFHRRTRPTSVFPFRNLERSIRNDVTKSSYLTLEALASHVARLSLEFLQDHCDSVTVKASKYSALVCAEGPEVEITRLLKDGSLAPHYSGGIVYKTPVVTTSNSVEPPPTAPVLATGLSTSDESKHLAALAIGSNLGDSFYNIELALRLLETPGVHYNRLPEGANVTIIDTSFMYETEPMYVTDQPKFVNCACLIETTLSPLELLNLLKQIESIVGRVASFRNGPRAIDLDILLFDSKILDTRPLDERDSDDLEGHLVIPHPKMLEREFVLRPLNDMIPDCIHPVAKLKVQDLLSDVVSKETEPQVMHKVSPFPQYPLVQVSKKVDLQLPNLPAVPSTSKCWTFPISPSSPRKTYIMGTLNVTPDSFSDGRINNTITTGLSYAQSAVQGGAHIIDIGGYSTRPGAAFVSAEEEMSRVVPMVQAIRSYQSDGSGVEVRQTLLSVDTFRWEVAEEAVHAGANCINDVCAFSGPEYPVGESGKKHLLKIRQVARDLAVPVILMHSRGEASSNKDYTAYNYAADSRGRGAVVEAVKVELGEKVDTIVKGKGGLRRWLVIVDPGIGFSKTVDGNLELLRNASSITEDFTRKDGARNALCGYPQLIGTSRKSFLGTLLHQADSSSSYAGRETAPAERGWATAAAVSCAVQQRAAVVRVHDVLEMGDAVRISDALWG
ncbi:hypothetical protein QCA50_020943 [Cerrena zonata]|uniref:Pterin-binding domain-containing protein n=1 Tax=Cerrena zonata TaxID=2478898 RepID=A0AAW0F7H5_9APHY